MGEHSNGNNPMPRIPSEVLIVPTALGNLTAMISDPMPPDRNSSDKFRSRHGAPKDSGPHIKKPTREADIQLPPAGDWRTSDEDEIQRRRLRAREESFQIRNTDTRFPIFSNFTIHSASGQSYNVEIRDIATRQFHCTCHDFRKNGLGTCKHAEAVLLHLESRSKKRFQHAAGQGSPRIDLVIDSESKTLWVERGSSRLPASIKNWFAKDGCLSGASIDEAIAAFEKLRQTNRPEARVSQEVGPWHESEKRVAERRLLRREYELKIQSGEWPTHETKVPLFPYQRDGMLHLAFTERALLADEMGLGKTIQAIAACALLKRLGKAQRVLVVSPASLKTEWEEQIRMFTDLPCRPVFGGPSARRTAYDEQTFFTVVNYEQLIRDAAIVNQRFKPDVVILDEAQRIKNWSTLSAQAVKRLESRYAFVLTGTPIENRIDELYSIVDFLDPSILGPLFRFNREYFTFDDRGRPAGYRNLGKLSERIAPYLLRRRKSDVETELPARVDRNHFVSLSPKQHVAYTEYKEVVARLVRILKRRPLTKQEQDRLMIHLAMMRMTCDTNYILDPKERECPKLDELQKILEECRENAGVKVIIFSEWERMLELVRGLCQKLDMGFAWHTGSVPQQKRRAEIIAFKSDPGCRVFLSTDCGATGLNLQNASVVINCDLPWNPAKLEQRIARAWRKHQTKTVSIINLISEDTIEHQMLATLANKQALADGVLDRQGDLDSIPLRTGQQSFLKRLQMLVTAETALPPDGTHKATAELPSDRPMGFAEETRGRLGGSLLRCEERFLTHDETAVLYVVVDGAVANHSAALLEIHQKYFPTPAQAEAAKLEIVDAATDATIERLIAAGVIARTYRAARPLHPVSEVPRAISPENLKRRTEASQRLDDRLRLGRLLAQGGFSTEARSALIEALSAGIEIAAINRHLGIPEPKDWFSRPYDTFFGHHLTGVKTYVTGTSSDPQPVLKVLESTGNEAASP